MTYQVLARKWRPQTFATLVGQQHVLQALVNALDLKRLHHAYLFTGTRGVGKTTIARLIAKALNCEQGIGSQPCGQCSACIDIAAGRFVDLLEVDAASRTKVEDTRDLLENVQYAPTRGRFKVYLIDEVHMLSGHSFNALLKTLEEPPAHVKFLLATTDPQKLPVTVLSRCLQFHLKNLQPPQIAQHLADILTQERLSFEQTALQLLAQAANGSMRDALSLLDQAIAVGGETVRQESVEAMLGVTSDQVLVDLLQALQQQSLPTLLAVSDQLQAVGADYAYVLMRLQEMWHQVALRQFGVQTVIAAPTISAMLDQLAQTFGPEAIQLFYEITGLGRRDLALAPSPKTGFDMVLVRLLAFAPANGVVEKPKAPAGSVAVNPPPVSTKAPTLVAPVSQPTDLPPWETAAMPSKPAPAAKPSVTVDSDPWTALVPQLGLTAFSKVLAEHLCYERQEGDHFYLSLAESHAMMLQERHQRKIIEALTGHFQRPIRLTIQIGRSDRAKSALEVQQDQHQAKVSQALHSLAQDAPLQRVLQSFDGKILPATLQLDEA